MSLFSQILVGLLVGAGLMFASRLLQRPRLDLGSQAPQTFGFNARRNAIGTGLPVSIVYGTHRVFPRLIQQFIESLNDQEYLYALYAVSEGPIQSVTAIEINEQPSANFANVTLETRLGTSGQTVIPWFQDGRNTFSVGVSLPADGNAHTYTSAGLIDAFIVKIRFPNGLQGQTPVLGAGGGAGQVVVLVEYRVVGAGGFTTLGTFTITEHKPNTNFVRQFRADNLTRARYEIRVTRSSSIDPTLNPMTYDAIDEIVYGINTYPNVALLGVLVQASDQLSGEAPRVSALVEGRTVRTLTGGVLSGGETFSENPVECFVDLLTHTRYGLGGYIVDADLILSSFQTGKDYCNNTVTDPVSEARHRLGIVLDEQRPAFEWTDALLNTFRGLLIEADGRWKLAVDHTGTVSQVFSDTNIIQGSFKTSWVSLTEEFDQVEVVFLDASNNYTRESVRFPDGTFSKSKSIQLYGITRRSHALREAKYHLNAISALSRLVEFDCAIEALAVEVGDLIMVSHNVPQWGFSGRVMGITTADAGVNHVITVDRGDLPTGGLSSYALAIRKQTDAIETKTTLLSVSAPYTTTEGYSRQDVRVSGLFSPVPTVRDSVWVFGLVAEVAKTFRVLAITLNEDLTRHVTGMEYNAAIYDSAGLVLPARSPTLLPNPDAPPNAVTTLTLTARRIMSNDGSVAVYVDAAWNAPAWTSGAGQFGYARVYVSLYQGTDDTIRRNSAVFAGRSDRYVMQLGPFPTNLSPSGTTVAVYVVAVSTAEVAQALAAAANTSISVTATGIEGIVDNFLYTIEPGDEVDPNLWVVTKSGTGVPDITSQAVGDGEVRLATGTTSANSIAIACTRALRALAPLLQTRLEWRGYLSHASGSSITFSMGLGAPIGYVFATRAPTAYVEAGTNAGTIKFRSNLNEVGLDEVTDNIAVDVTVAHIYIIMFDVSPAQIRLYVDGTLRATHSTKVTSLMAAPTFFVRADNTTEKWLQMDYVSMVPVR